MKKKKSSGAVLATNFKNNAITKLIGKVFFSFFFLVVLTISASAQSGTNTINAGAKLLEGQRLISANKNYYLLMQADGNLCIYTSNNQFVWCSMLYSGKGSSVTMQADGNLVVYSGTNQPVWYTMTQGFFDPKYATAEWKPVRAVLEDNGTLCLYTAANKKVWTNTDRPEPPIVDPGIGFTGPTVKKELSIKLPGSRSNANYIVEINNRGEAFYTGDVNLGAVENLMKKADALPEPESSFKWPNSTIPYVLPVGHARKDNIQKGIEQLNKYSSICLVPRTTEKDYVEFISRDGNWSALGRVGGRQEISVENTSVGTVIHEIMHALGFHHTQCRQDRDNYVTIYFANIQKGKEGNFQKSADNQSNIGTYDFSSVMHYFGSAFALKPGLVTIASKNGEKAEMGQRVGLSQTDVDNIATIYPACSGKTVEPLPTTTPTPTTPITTPAKPLTNPATCEGKDAAKKYQTSMKLGDMLQEKETLVSSNGRFQLRGTLDGNFIIEEVLSGGNCPYKEVFRFPLDNGGTKPNASFLSYNTDGNICIHTKQGKTYCATNGKDAVTPVIIYKSQKLELTDDGRLRLVNSNGQEIWATSPANSSKGTTTTTTGTGSRPGTTTTTTGTRPGTTTPTPGVRPARTIAPIVDKRGVVPIPALEQFTSGRPINLLYNQEGGGVDIQYVKVNWWNLSQTNARDPKQAIDGKKTTTIFEDQCASGEALTPGWQIDLGKTAYVDHIVIWNNIEATTLSGRNFFIYTGTDNIRFRATVQELEPAAGNLQFYMSAVYGYDEGPKQVEPLGPYKWETGKESFTIPIKRNLRHLSISLQKDGILTTPLTMEEVEFFGIVYGREERP